MKCALRVAIAGAAMLAPLVGLSAPPRLGGILVDGSVVRIQGCGVHFFVAYRDEYALVSWVGGEYVKEGDVLIAVDESSTFEHEGRGIFTNLATGLTVEILIDKALINRQQYARVVRQVCR